MKIDLFSTFFMATYTIKGNTRLKGKISVNSAKNSALALLSASVMTEGITVLRNMPRIEEVNRFIEILVSINVSCVWTDEDTLTVDSSRPLDLEHIDRRACARIRSSLLLIGSIASRTKSYTLYRSGGCKLGVRTVRPHLYALEKIGLSIHTSHDRYDIVHTGLKGTKIIMHEAGDTPTENIIMAAVRANGITTIKFASANYMVQDLCYFLVTAGAKISGIGTSTLVITGVKSLKKKVTYHVMPDPLEAMTFIAASITTQSSLIIQNCPLDFLELELEKLSMMGQSFTLRRHRQSENGKFSIVDIEMSPSVLEALPDKIHGMPFPGINIDHIPFFVPIAIQARGRTLIHDWVFENRSVYYLEFVKMGAKVTMLDPHRVIIDGPSKLIATDIVAPDAIRPAVAVLVGMLGARGTSVLRDVYVIERGYENIVERLRQVGAHITRTE